MHIIITACMRPLHYQVCQYLRPSLPDIGRYPNDHNKQPAIKENDHPINNKIHNGENSNSGNRTIPVRTRHNQSTSQK